VGRVVPAAPASAARVELRLAGTFGVTCEGTELSDGEVGSRKSRVLLKLLTVERPGLVSTARIIDVLWAGKPPGGAEQNVATLVSRLRGALGPGVILGGRQGYRLAGEPRVSVDLDVAARYCDQAERKLASAAAVARTAAEQAIELLSTGTAVAEEPYAAWAATARDEVQALLRRARLAAAEAAVAMGDSRSAARFAEAGIAADPLDEAAYRWYMAASDTAGEPAKALTAYAALQARLSEELGADPAPQTRELHLAILREQRAGSAQSRPDPGRPDPVPSSRPEPGHLARARSGRLLQGRRRPGLTGRETETAGLHAAWDRAAAGEPGLVMIIGEAGIGKTALAEDLAAEAAEGGAVVLRARCYEAERSLFLQPVLDAVAPAVSRMPASALRGLLREHADAAAAVLPEAAALLGPPPSWRGHPDLERRRSFQAMTALLAGLAARTPVLFFVDDLQYAGQSTTEFIHFLARQVHGSRLLVVVTVRAEYAAHIGSALDQVATRIEVGPLSAAAVGQLAHAAGHGRLASPIVQRTRGHTLFVVEVLRAIAAGDSGVPGSLRSAVQARLQRTGPAAEALLRAASVLGSSVDPLVLGDLLGLPAASVLELCEQALEARLLVVSGRDYEFANDLIQEVVYATTPEPTRLAYHRRAADLLTGQPESLARHAAAAADWPRAARAWLLAAEEAMRQYAASDAGALATQALDAAQRGDSAEVGARALVVRGRAHEASGAHDDALADLTKGAAAARAAGDRRLEMLALRELGGDVPVSRGLPISYYSPNLENGLRIAESLGDRASEADLLSRLAIIAANRLRLGAALDYGLRAVAAARASADDRALAAGLDGLKLAYLSIGDTRGLAAVLAELSPLALRLGDLFRLPWAEFESGFLPLAAGDLAGAAAAFEQGTDVIRRAGYPHSTAWFVAHSGWLARLRGHDEDALRLGREAVALTEAHEHLWWRAAACALLGGTVLLTGDRAGAIGLFERGLAAAEEAGVEAYLLRCAAPLAAATGSRTILDDADRLLDQAGMPAGGAWLPGDDAYFSLARAWLDRGDPERAQRILAPLLGAAEREPWRVTLAAALVVEAHVLLGLGESRRAGENLRRAAELARKHGLPHVLSDVRTAQCRLS
jgi:DNA-binding SARP family transcriptional activator